MIEYKYFDFFKADSTHKKLTLFFNDGTVFDNEKIWEESLELKEALCEEKNLFFGSCESSELKIKIWNSGSYIGKKIDVIMQIEDFAEQLPIGKFIVVSDKPTADKKYRDIIAYDLMYEIIKSDVAQWYNKILPDADSEITLKEFRNSFFEYFGIEQESVELVNDSMIIQKTIETNSLSGKDVITAICEINGCFGHIGRDGKFKYIFLKEMGEGLYPSDALYPSDTLYPRDAQNAELVSRSHYIKATYEDFTTAKIDKLQIRQEEDDIGVIHGSGDNCYIVQDNFLVYGKGSEELAIIATKLYSVICNIWYQPAHVEAKGNPCLEVGDGIRLGTRYETVYTYILQRTLKGIQALKDTYDAEGEQYQSKDVNSMHESLIQLKAKTNKLSRTLEETRSEIASVERDIEENYSTTEEMNSAITQRADSITTEVNKKISETRTYANGVAEEARKKAETNASVDATNKANQAESNAIADTDAKLKSYSTTTQMNSAIEQKADKISLTVNQQILETKEYANEAAETAKNEAVSSANRYSDSELSTYKDYVDENLKTIQSQLDGQIESHFYDYEPTLTNLPASEWITEEQRIVHEGDLFFWTSKGYSYRFFKDGATWGWQLIEDSDVTKALAMAEQAQDTADGKRRTFVITPYAPYDIGDLWCQQDGDILVCTTAKAATGNYAASDWQKYNKYTDKATAQKLSNQAEANAKADTAEKLKSYSTTTQMNSAISAKADEISLKVSKTYSTKTETTSAISTAKSEAISTASTDATTKANNALSSANNNTATLLKSYSTTTQMNSAIAAKANEITLSVSEMYETKEDSIAKRDELSGKITLNANNITAEVKRAQEQEKTLAASINVNANNISLKVSKGNISSEISQEAGKITIKSNRFSLKSTNCTITADGTISAKNVDLTGKITATSGEIGGLTISSKSIYYNKSSFSNSTSGIYVGQDGIAVGYGSGTQSAFSVSADGNVFIGYDKDIETKGGIDFTAITYAKIKYSGAERIAFDSYGLDLKGDVSVCDIAGRTLSFFGGTGSTRKSITNITSTSSATVASVATKLNELIDALQAYNLIG